ncbi:VIT1/CCC1 transporter family protein [Candidatus Saccharibacteria bacterium]|nr:VIT1/CCC1 transporter family protein [Candidatus Saccharibacteria bacterium]
MKQIKREYLRSTLFGVEDSLVSTTGLIAGLSVGANSNRIVILGGVVAIVIEAVSMGAGEYLSDDAVKELDKIDRNPESASVSGLLMFSSYLLAGLIPLTPILILDYPTSLITSVLAALAALFLLGYVKGRILRVSAFKGGLKILIIGGLATALGIIVGFLFKIQNL